MAAQYPVAAPVIVPYEKIADPNAELNAEIEQAYGYSGLGLIVITGVPDLVRLRKTLLPLALKFAKLPVDVKEKTANPDSHYSFGWSHGKEKLRRGRFDIYKGSYYNNPQYDVPSTDPEAIKKAPEVLSPNVWPKEDFPELEPAFKECGHKVCDVGAQLGHHVDKYVKSKLGDRYTPQLENVIKSTRTTKGRLLHYFPIPSDGARDVDSWCGWHNDHSALTGLVPNMFMDVATEKEVPSPDPDAGLYAKTRDGAIVRVRIPPDALAFQIGECTQVFTGAIVRATPHAVRALKFPESQFLSRETFAVFMQPNFDYLLAPPSQVKIEDVAVGQFKDGMTFGEFGKATIQFYYGADGGYE
jgi:isopenicillin N synthase-like dioxygenase